MRGEWALCTYCVSPCVLCPALNVIGIQVLVLGGINIKVLGKTALEC